MKLEVDQIPLETKWAMTAKGLTGAMTAHLDAIYRVLGNQKYSEMVRELWAQIGKGAAEQVKASGMTVADAQSVAAAGVTSCVCCMGPEVKIEPVEASEKRTVIKIIECPWKNRLVELGISEDLLSACDLAFWKHFTKNLNPNVKMKHGKQMHKGDPYCEWIFEKKS